MVMAVSIGLVVVEMAISITVFRLELIVVVIVVLVEFVKRRFFVIITAAILEVVTMVLVVMPIAVHVDVLAVVPLHCHKWLLELCMLLLFVPRMEVRLCGTVCVCLRYSSGSEMRMSLNFRTDRCTTASYTTN